MSNSLSEPTLADALRSLWRARLYLLAGGVLGVLAAALVLGAAVPHYRASMLVSPTTRTGSPDISSLFPENAGYAIEYVLRSFGPADSSDFMRFEQILRGPAVAQRLLKDDDAMAGISRDRFFTFLPPPVNTPEKLAAYLQNHLKVEPVGNTPMRKLVYDHPDQVFATKLLSTLHRMADTIIREGMREKTARRVAWLGETIGQIQNPEHRRTLTTLLMQQEQIRMILALDEPYAALIAEPPAAASDKPSWPRKPIVLPAGLLIGMVLGFALHGLRRRP